MRSAKGNVASTAEGDARYRLGRTLEERGDTAYGTKRYDRAEQFFNWARRLYSTAKVASLPENALQVGLDDMTAIYREALHQRDMAALQTIFANFTTRDEGIWQQFIEQGGGVTIYTSTANIKISGDSGTADVALHLDYSDPQNSLKRSVLNYTWAMKKTGSGWVVSEMRSR